METATAVKTCERHEEAKPKCRNCIFDTMAANGTPPVACRLHDEVTRYCTACVLPVDVDPNGWWLIDVWDIKTGDVRSVNNMEKDLETAINVAMGRMKKFPGSLAVLTGGPHGENLILR